ncbi:MAG: phosphoenolpyruvate synthase [Candidatus Woykebacteria bacterium GWB1_45_5]|uniref:Phosphoenolpyruvate synthase n=1 Tax=Candidatus Woykebacteria bacterium GWB1_45_5 TaxID=1802592 RepID=A0A1G1W350_9BACT|nr:MAG: phosphoenolpyruvate synthase [Candidatus Woykebacteria bacterium GWB1_45_5]
MSKQNKKLVCAMEEVRISDVALVGGKNASLGEMLQNLGPKGIRIPSGFIVTAEAYRKFLTDTGLNNSIKKILAGLNTGNLDDLNKRAKKVRGEITAVKLPEDLLSEIKKAYEEMEQKYGKDIDVAVRSSATAEDLPGASFAGEHDTYLGVRGATAVATAVKSAFASLFTERAISYRVDKGFDHLRVALSVGVQKMVRSDLASSGVMFTLDTESGFKDLIIVNGSWGLGETIVQGEVTPDEFLVFKKVTDSGKSPIISRKLGSKGVKLIYGGAANKVTKQTRLIPTSKQERESFVLNEDEINCLAKWGKMIEEHYSQKAGKWMPMDTEWAKDGKTGELFIVQARPETIHASRDFSKIKEYTRKGEGIVLLRGASVGSKIATGRARVIMDAKNMNKFVKGEILVTDMTDPDWEPIMKIASAIVTDKGGRTSHAAIVSRELGIPAIVGSELATKKIKTGDMITVDTTGSEGVVLQGSVAFEVIEQDVGNIPKPETKVMLNIATPDTAFEKSFLPNQGVGLAREEFIIASNIGIHPMALLNHEHLPIALKKKIDKKTLGWNDKRNFYIDNLAYGIAKIAAAFHPHHVIVRFSDFKTNEYRTLLGGEMYEPEEENPMIGWRGASRYYDDKFKEAFKMECQAMKKVRNDMGLDNVIPMVPFCRTPEEGRKTREIMNEMGLDGPVYVMCEIPSNILLADQFLDIFDGMSIGSNDLTQLVLGLDRDSGIVNHVANEDSESVKKMISEVIKKCNERNKYIGICGQAPSDYPGFAAFLVRAGIKSISLNPDTIIKTTIAIFNEEQKLKSGNIG